MPDTAVQLRKCFQTLFPRLTEVEIENASTENVAEWDSIATVSMVSLIEEEFGVEIDFEELENLTSYAHILAHLDATLAK